MTSSARYVPGRGIILALNGAGEGITIVIPDDWIIAKIERHLREMSEFLG
jgi:hypothetical protein